jgi:hypothetical protein
VLSDFDEGRERPEQFELSCALSSKHMIAPIDPSTIVSDDFFLSLVPF